MKATATAPSNIAFIKYWGKKDEELRLPENGSVSMNLSNLLTTTTVEFDSKYEADEIIIDDDLVELDSRLRGNDKKIDENEKRENPAGRVLEHLDRVREMAKIEDRAKVVSKNNFPSGTGLSSSASGFAALTVAAASSAGLELSEKELSILARLGSGSASRSIPDGFSEWIAGSDSESSYATSLYPADYWDITDVVAVVSKSKKDVGSTEGQKLANSSLFYPLRLSKMSSRIKLLKKYLMEKNFTKFGELVEGEALEMHAIMMTSIPSLLYIMPESLRILHLVKKWRSEGLEVYFTLNTGQDVHIICQKRNVRKVYQLLTEVPEVKQILVNDPGKGARLTSNHLF